MTSTSIAAAEGERPDRVRRGFDADQRWWFLLVVLTVAVSLQTFRVLFPQMYGFTDRHGDQAAAATAFVLFATAFLTPAVRRLTGPAGRTSVLLILALWRLWAVAATSVPFGLTVAATVVALLSATLVITTPCPVPPLAAAQAVLAGIGLDAAIRCAFATWDPIWQRTFPAIAVGVLMSGGLAMAALSSRHAKGDRAMIADASGGTAIGPVLALELLFLASPSFVASSVGISLPLATFVVLSGISIGLAATSIGTGMRPLERIGLAALLLSAAYLLPGASGALAAVFVVGGQVAAAALIGATSAGPGSSRLHAELGVAGGWLLFVLVVLLYQIHFDQPLPFDNRWVVTFGAAVALLAVDRRRRRPGTAVARAHGLRSLVAAGMVAAAVLAMSLASTGTTSTAAAVPGRPLRVVEWNIRQAVSRDGTLAPDTIASVLRRGPPPDVIVLPETARGWPLSGDIDLASWLSRQLGVPYRWAPAADRQFGTLLLTRLPVLASGVVRLPVAGRSQRRSVLHATLDAGDGTPLTVLATHLQARNDPASIAARQREIDVVLRQWRGTVHTIVIGDLNPRQGDPPLPARRPSDFPEIRGFLDAGFTTAQELTACSQPTSGRNCSDFVLVSPDIAVQTQVVPDDTFDHRPVISSMVLTR